MDISNKIIITFIIIFLISSMYVIWYIRQSSNSFEPVIIRLGHCRHAGTDWGYSKHNKILEIWKELSVEFEKKNLFKMTNDGILCCPSFLEENHDLSKYIRIDVISGNSIKYSYSGDYSKESIRKFIQSHVKNKSIVNPSKIY